MPVQKRKKGVKGQPNTPTTEYGELKKNVKMTLTPTAIASLDATATVLGISRSELIERYARSLMEKKTVETEIQGWKCKFIPTSKGWEMWVNESQIYTEIDSLEACFEIAPPFVERSQARIKKLIKEKAPTSGNDSIPTED
jgi:hypothetical protein